MRPGSVSSSSSLTLRSLDAISPDRLDRLSHLDHIGHLDHFDHLGHLDHLDHFDHLDRLDHLGHFDAITKLLLASFPISLERAFRFPASLQKVLSMMSTGCPPYFKEHWLGILAISLPPSPT